MSRRAIKQKLTQKFNAWVKSIADEEVKKLVKTNAFITGGAIVSLLNREEPNDYDIYFLNKETALAVAKYYADEWNKTHKRHVTADAPEDGRVRMYVRSAGIASEADEDAAELANKPEVTEEDLDEAKRNRKDYRPVFISTNAISLSEGVQLVIRFFGSPEEVHRSFDFAHTKCYYIPSKKELVLPPAALESIIMKGLVYEGSLYPIASILRSKKFIKRGWSCNAGQYLKMILQVQNLNLTNPHVLEDQLTGVDYFYFSQVIHIIQAKLVDEPDFKLDSSYLISVVEKVFDGAEDEE